jgi:hypothetical protein
MAAKLADQTEMEIKKKLEEKGLPYPRAFAKLRGLLQARSSAG